MELIDQLAGRRQIVFQLALAHLPEVLAKPETKRALAVGVQQLFPGLTNIAERRPSPAHDSASRDVRFVSQETVGGTPKVVVQFDQESSQLLMLKTLAAEWVESQTKFLELFHSATNASFLEVRKIEVGIRTVLRVRENHYHILAPLLVPGKLGTLAYPPGSIEADCELKTAAFVPWQFFDQGEQTKIERANLRVLISSNQSFQDVLSNDFPEQTEIQTLAVAAVTAADVREGGSEAALPNIGRKLFNGLLSYWDKHFTSVLTKPLLDQIDIITK